MRYKLDLVKLIFLPSGIHISIFLIAFFGGLSYSPYIKSQNKTYRALSADLGTSLNRTLDDTLVRQGLLLPVYGISASVGRVVGHGVSLKATLGYRNRGGVAKVNAEVNPATGKTLGRYKIYSRDHFLSNDISVRLNARYWRLSGLIPFLDLGVRNDIYLLSNNKTQTNDAYFQPDKKGVSWFRSRHNRPYVVGLAGVVGVEREKWGFGLEYYHQILGTYLIPSAVKSNYSQLYSRSLQANVTYRF